jgi:hypothetical protein
MLRVTRALASIALAVGLVPTAEGTPLPVERVSPALDIYRGGRPGESEFAELREFGVVTDLDLEDSRKGPDAAAAIAAEQANAEQNWSIQFVPAPFLESDVVDASVDVALATLRNPAALPVYVHCREGKNRTGLVVALARVLLEGLAPQDAFNDMLAHCFHFEKHPNIKTAFEQRLTMSLGREVRVEGPGPANPDPAFQDPNFRCAAEVGSAATSR